jgi:antitoxin ParD1/3/4
MRKTHPVTVTLSDEMAAFMREKVTSGEYVTESEVIRDGLRALQARDAALERWLRDEAAKSYDAYAADPNNRTTGHTVIEEVRSSYRKHLTKSGQ